MTKERRGTPCWWEDLLEKGAVKEKRVTGDPKVCRERKGAKVKTALSGSRV